MRRAHESAQATRAPPWKTLAPQFTTYQTRISVQSNGASSVFKKRLNDNMHRSIILAKGGRFWVYEYLFAKNDRDNIADDEFAGFRALAKAYAGLTDRQVEQLLQDKDLMEVCHDD